MKSTVPLPSPIDRLHGACHRWLGDEYDLDAIDVVVAAAAVERMTGDPLWVLVVSGPGAAKTETVQPLAGAGAIITSTITSEGALLSGSSRRDKAKNATGGLLKKLEPRGILVIKDVTSILSMHRDARAQVLAALREVYDGYWARTVGSDGGQTLPWQGRIAVIGAVTTAWDAAHQVVSTMGDRFVLIRLDSTLHGARTSARRQAILNTGSEVEMRKHLAEAVDAVVATVKPTDAITLTADETECIGAAADVVTLCRTAVEFDYRGDIIDAHAPEMPTRFAKQLTQVVRGAVAIGLNRDAAMRLALRCARDSMPPIRYAILTDVAKHPHSRASDVRRRIDKPWSTVDRQLKALHMLRVLVCDEVEVAGKSQWHYSVADHVDTSVLLPKASPEMSPHIHKHTSKEEEEIED